MSDYKEMGGEFQEFQAADEDGLTAEQREIANRFEGYHEKPVVPESSSSEVEKEISRFERMIEDFEATYPLDKLHDITELTLEQAQAHPFREPARKALIPITKLRNEFKALAEKSKISWAQFEVLEAKYMKISLAVGYHQKATNKIRQE
jgi:hypothetical protein